MSFFDRNKVFSSSADEQIRPDCVYSLEREGDTEDTFLCRLQTSLDSSNVGNISDMLDSPYWQILLVRKLWDSGDKSYTIYYLYPDGSKEYKFSANLSVLKTHNYIFAL